MTTNSKIHKRNPPKSASTDKEGQLKLYSPDYAVKVNSNYKKKSDDQSKNMMASKIHKGPSPKSASTDEEGQLELYSPEYAVKMNSPEVKEEGVKMKHKKEGEEKEKDAAAEGKKEDNGGPLVKPLAVRLTSRL
ncbi:PREDICTED: uncharacterized protein LOC109205828 [Nicotiana attenuata]|uniref:Uncharacterized protein n=1 Tax=Nicotiana attenuata TaxID=49451 RepID=A0A314KWA5_NICAT|nr:PREDICTED: uncharacterized protein LOC109205828 [Nicotiana attenuata]OIT33583.1 hypothetical protein A4A49_11501 [Nicotiana attenuata]